MPGQVVDAMPNEQVVEAVRELESDDAVYVLESLEESEQTDILAKLPKSERIALQRSLDFPEDSAGRLMQTDYISVPPFWSVAGAASSFGPLEGSRQFAGHGCLLLGQIDQFAWILC